jgi:hypothetical protein
VLVRRQVLFSYLNYILVNKDLPGSRRVSVTQQPYVLDDVPKSKLKWIGSIFIAHTRRINYETPHIKVRRKKSCAHGLKNGARA